MKALFIRLDKIGDLIATLPVDELPFLKSKAVTVQWIVTSGLGWIPKVAKPERTYFEVDPGNSQVATQKLLDYLRAEKPDVVVTFYAPWWVGYACWRAGVPLRVTRRSQWHSFLFYNRGLRQSRSLAEKHEADYNRELVEFAFHEGPGTTPFLKLEPVTQRHLFEKHDLRSGEYFVVHPGMAGSALNWPQSHYNILIEKLVNAGTVVITGTAGDDPYLTEIRPQWEKDSRVRWLQNKLQMDELLSVLKTARGVVAPSTGVLHLAACLGTPCVGIYSPILVHRAVRWGPRGPRAVALSPSTEDPNCMETIKVNDVLKALGL